jgi:hypothetical protein
MTATCSSVTVIQNKLCFFMSKTSSKNAIHPSTIQSVIEDEIVSRLVSYSSTLIMRSRSRGTSKSEDTQVYLHTRGLKMQSEKYLPLIGDSSGEISPLSTDSSKINSAKTKDFLDFTETKSKSNSWRITIHRLIFPPMTRHVNTY